MKYTLIVLLLLVFAISGCATGGRPSTATERASLLAGCSEGNLKFHIGGSEIKVTPPNKCVERGMTYDADIKEKVGFTAVEGDVTIEGPVGWLDRTNSPDRLKIQIVVPEDAPLGPQKYELIVDGVGTIDPVVRVK